MIRPAWTLAFGTVAVGLALVAPSPTEAAPYYYTKYYDDKLAWPRDAAEPMTYAATYLGKTTDVREADGRLTNDRTGASVAFARPATVDYAGRQPLDDFRDLPAVAINPDYQFPGTNTPVFHSSLRVIASNAAGTVLGSMPDPSRGSLSESSKDFYYTTRQPDGSYSRPTFVGYGGVAPPILTESNQILWGTPSFERLLDVNSGTSSEIRPYLIPDELKDRYSNFGIRGISSTGDLLVAAYRGYDDPGDEYLLSPTAQEAAVPEPSTLCIAAATIAGLAYRARRRRDR